MRYERHAPPPGGPFSGPVVLRLALLGTALLAVTALVHSAYRDRGSVIGLFQPFLAPAHAGAADAVDLGLANIDQDPAGARAEIADAPRQVNPLGLTQIDECLEVDRNLLERVKDNTAGRAEESPAIYQMLCVAATIPRAQLAALSRRDVTFSNLFHEPDLYRGKPIHLVGVLCRLTARADLDLRNPYSIPVVYEAWIFTENQLDDPMVVLLTKLPEGLTPGEELRENVALDAFFFKKFAYQRSNGQWHAAPMLIGHGIEWSTIDRTGGTREAILLGGGFVLLLVVGFLVFWWGARRDDRLARRYREIATKTAIEPVPTKPVGELFEDSPAPADSTPRPAGHPKPTD